MISRKTSGLLGLASTIVMLVACLGFLIYLQLPVAVIAGAAIFLAFIAALRVISYWRGSRARRQGYSTFEHNALGAPVTEEFHSAYQAELALSPEEKIVALAAPIMQVASGWKNLMQDGTTEVMGKAVVRDGENALILTDRRLLLLMLGPGEVKSHAGESTLVGVLEALPGDAPAKRRWLWLKGGELVRRALEGISQSQDLSQIMQSVFNYTIPLADILHASHHPRSQGLKIQLRSKAMQYSFRNAADLAAVRGKLAELGVQVTESNKMW